VLSHGGAGAGDLGELRGGELGEHQMLGSGSAPASSRCSTTARRPYQPELELRVEVAGLPAGTALATAGAVASAIARAGAGPITVTSPSILPCPRTVAVPIAIAGPITGSIAVSSTGL
jgi:hypothetical protein